MNMPVPFAGINTIVQCSTTNEMERAISTLMMCEQPHAFGVDKDGHRIFVSVDGGRCVTGLEH